MEGKDPKLTYRISRDADLLQLERMPYGARPESGFVGYIRLPLGDDEIAPRGVSWRLLLELTGDNQGWLALEIVDDTSVGRGGKESEVPDLDMAVLKAEELGVSRRHALLRPTTNHLYLIDLGSTNRTLVNGFPLWRGRAHPLAEGDHLSLGRLNLSIARLEPIREAKHERDTDALAPPSLDPAKGGRSEQTPPVEDRQAESKD